MTTRPPEFDAIIVKYTPGLRKLAARLTRNTEAAGLLYVDTVIKALEKWECLRADGGPWKWLQFFMRGLARDNRERLRVEEVEDPTGMLAAQGATPAAQYDSARLSEVLRGLPNDRETAILLRRVAGDQLAEIGADYGIGKERVRQLEERARAGLVKRERRAVG